MDIFTMYVLKMFVLNASPLILLQMFAVHVLKPSHVKKVAEAMKVRVAVDPILTNITCEVQLLNERFVYKRFLFCLTH